MKSPTSLKCVQRVFLALAAATGLSLMIACGSSNSANPNNNGFDATFLNGTYVFSTAGSDSTNGTLIALAGAFTADGKGGISGGNMDAIDPAVGVSAGVSITSGSYSVSSDGRGQAKLTSSAGTFTLRFVLTTAPAPSSHGLISEFDSIGTGSGTLDLQTAPTQSALAGPFAFSFAGSDSTGNPFASAGAFTLNSSGTSTGGTVDFNRVISGTQPTPSLGLGLSVSALLGSGTAPGTATFNSSYAPNATFDFYPIDSTHWKMIETDNTYFLAGDVYTQTGFSTIPSGSFVFTLAGGTNNSGPISAGGYMTSSGSGNFPTGLEDVNITGNATGSIPFLGTAAGAPGTGGRVLIGLNGFSPAIQWVAYPSSGGVLLMETDTVNLLTGSAVTQTSTSFNAPDGYGLNLTGTNANSAVDVIGQFNATTATSPATNMTGVLDENDQGTLYPGATLSGTYTPDSPATGRGGISVTSNGGYQGGFTLEYYTIDASDALFIDIDNTQVAVGTFEGQSGITPAVAAASSGAGVAGAGVAASSSHRFETVAHPFVKSKLAKKTK